jgi:hypothetical protein
MGPAPRQLRLCLRSDPEYKPCLQLRRTLKTVATALEAGQQLVTQGRWPQAVQHYAALVNDGGALAAAAGLPRQRHTALQRLCEAYVKVRPPHACTLLLCGPVARAVGAYAGAAWADASE